MTDKDLIYPNEPLTRWTINDFNDFLVWAYEFGASDVKMQPQRPVWICYEDQWHMAGGKLCTSDEIAALTNDTARSQDASEQAIASAGFDYSYEVVKGGANPGGTDFDPHSAVARRYRFRANATGCRDGVGTGIELTMRTVPAKPFTVEQLNVPKKIIEASTPVNGLILVCGTMGSGKSTLLAAILRYINENTHRSIATFEAPIEYDQTAIDKPLGPVAQSEIPRHFKSFALAARNATRRKLDVVLIGESRDKETVGSMLENAETGTLVFTTLHTRSVAETPDRIINMFPEDERPRIAVNFATAVRMIIYQRLVDKYDPKTGQRDGRMALMEYLNFDSELNTRLATSESVDYGRILRQVMQEEGRGQTLSAHATRLYEQGYICEADYIGATREAKELSQ